MRVERKPCQMDRTAFTRLLRSYHTQHMSHGVYPLNNVSTDIRGCA